MTHVWQDPTKETNTANITSSFQTKKVKMLSRGTQRVAIGILKSLGKCGSMTAEGALLDKDSPKPVSMLNTRKAIKESKRKVRQTLSHVDPRATYHEQMW